MDIPLKILTWGDSCKERSVDNPLRILICEDPTEDPYQWRYHKWSWNLEILPSIQISGNSTWDPDQWRIQSGSWSVEILLRIQISGDSTKDPEISYQVSNSVEILLWIEISGESNQDPDLWRCYWGSRSVEISQMSILKSRDPNKYPDQWIQISWESNQDPDL